MEDVELLKNIVINSFLIITLAIYVIFLALSCSYEFSFMKNICSSFDDMDRNKSNPAKYYPYYLGRSCASTVLIFNKLCILVPALIIMWVIKKVIDMQFTSFFELFFVLKLGVQLIVSVLGFVLYFLLLIHTLNFGKWLNGKQGESAFSLILETIIKKAI